MEKSAELNELAKALSKAQGEMQNAKKDSTNPFYKSSYADLSSVIDAAKKILSENGLSITQLASSENEYAVVTTMLLHSSGQWISDTLRLKPTKNDPQGMGSAITYARRYAYSAIIGMSTEEDDDGNSASNAVKKPYQPKQPLDDSLPEDIELLPQTTAQSASFNQFDPQKEIMTFGKKHNGVEWVNVPDSYLEWMSEAATGENQTKAKLTLEFKKNISKQVPDPLDDVFGKQESLIPPDELTLVEKLQYNLEDVVNKSGTVEALEGWKKINQADIDKLPASEKATLKKIYTNAIAKAKKESK